MIGLHELRQLWQVCAEGTEYLTELGDDGLDRHAKQAKEQPGNDERYHRP
jgi:hypothetical protein